MLNPKAKPTHILHINVPLNLDEVGYDYDPVRDAMAVSLAISRAAFAGHICDDPDVEMEVVGSGL